MDKDFLFPEERDDVPRMIDYIRESTGKTYVDLATLWLSDDVDGKGEQFLQDVRRGRSPPTLELYQAIRKEFDWVAAERAKLAPQPAAAVSQQLFTIREDMDLDEGKLRREIAELPGDYLCHIDLGDVAEAGKKPKRSIGTTWLTLYKMLDHDPFPKFSAWREQSGRSLIFGGYYYVYEGALHLLGHRQGRGHPWVLAAYPVEGMDGDYGGHALAADYDIATFSSRCYLQRMERAHLQARSDTLLGVKAASARNRVHAWLLSQGAPQGMRRWLLEAAKAG